jgi:hypothetical protein
VSLEFLSASYFVLESVYIQAVGTNPNDMATVMVTVELTLEDFENRYS